LLRILHTPHQTALPELQGLRVALLDDVMTTGATLTAATMALRDAGVAEVQVWVVARTPQPA
jgi:predicted amidophosphoribosyltransferase